MKLLIVLGGLLGFCIGFLFSWAEQGSGAICFFHASLAAYVTAVLMRWWGTAWKKGLAEAMAERHSTSMNPAFISKTSKS